MLNKFGSSVRTVIKINDNIVTVSHEKYTSMAVAINLNKPLISKVEIKGRVQLIEYENLPLICSTAEELATQP